MRVARWYCPKAQTTFSLLPDCLSSRLTGSLDDAEHAVALSEVVGIEAAAQALRVGDVELPGVLRWLRRRRLGVRTALLALVTAMPGRLGTVAEVRAVRSALDTDRALVSLREIGAAHLHALPPPLGFRPLRRVRVEGESALQHDKGPDPPDG